MATITLARMLGEYLWEVVHSHSQTLQRKKWRWDFCLARSQWFVIWCVYAHSIVIWRFVAVLSRLLLTCGYTQILRTAYSLVLYCLIKNDKSQVLSCNYSCWVGWVVQIKKCAPICPHNHMCLYPLCKYVTSSERSNTIKIWNIELTRFLHVFNHVAQNFADDNFYNICSSGEANSGHANHIQQLRLYKLPGRK